MQYFLKQFVAGDGSTHEKLLKQEVASAKLASSMWRGIEVMQPKWTLEEELVIVYPQQAIVPLDEEIRTGSQIPSGALNPLWRCIAEALAQSRYLPAAARGIPQKRTNVPTHFLILNFKGFEVRNISRGKTLGVPATAFDLGPAYVGPVEEAAARILVSIGLLNWGRPLGRFRSGPPFALLDEARTHLDVYLRHDAVLAEIMRQRRLRLKEMSFVGGVKSSVTTVPTLLIGRAYFRQLEAYYE